MTDLPDVFPFTKLEPCKGEVIRWVGFNPTFHRFLTYGIAISDVALYVCSRAWLFARWKRYSLDEISDVVVLDTKNSRPTIRFRAGNKTVAFSTPWDFHHEEMEFDRGVLSKAADRLRTASCTGAPH